MCWSVYDFCDVCFWGVCVGRVRGFVITDSFAATGLFATEGVVLRVFKSKFNLFDVNDGIEIGFEFVFLLFLGVGVLVLMFRKCFNVVFRWMFVVSFLFGVNDMVIVLLFEMILLVLYLLFVLFLLFVGFVLSN